MLFYSEIKNSKALKLSKQSLNLKVLTSTIPFLLLAIPPSVYGQTASNSATIKAPDSYVDPVDSNNSATDADSIIPATTGGTIPPNPSATCTINWHRWRTDRQLGRTVANAVNPTTHSFGKIDTALGLQTWYAPTQTFNPGIDSFDNIRNDNYGLSVFDATVENPTSARTTRTGEGFYGIAKFELEPNVKATIPLEDPGMVDGHSFIAYNSAGAPLARFPSVDSVANNGKFYIAANSQAAAGFVDADGIDEESGWTNDTFEVDVPADGIVYVHYVLADEGKAHRHALRYCPQDVGDAPVSYGIAAHTYDTDLLMGTKKDIDINLAGNGSASSDDNDGDGDNDEDGITLPSFTQGQTATITADVSGAGGYLQAWIDFDGNGTFEASEQIAADLQDGGTDDTSTTTGEISFTVPVPSDAVTTQTFARFRWSTTSGLDAITAAADGEVEDYAVTVQTATPPVAGFCTPYTPLRFVSPAETNPANGLLGWTNNSSTNTYTNVHGLGVDLVVETFNADGTTPQTSNFVKVWDAISPSAYPVVTEYTFYETGTTNPAEVENFTFTFHDFEVSETLHSIESRSRSGSYNSLNLQNDTSITTFSGSPNYFNGGQSIRGHYVNEGNMQNSKWQIIELPTGRYHKIRTNRSYAILPNLCRTPTREYSDAPTSYGVPFHEFDQFANSVKLGTSIDNEFHGAVDGYPSDASGDSADDDGVTIPTLTQGETATITADVTGAGGYLQAWVDFDGNGTFEAGEQVAADLQDGGTDDTSTPAGEISFTVPVPSDAVTTQTFTRFRWSTISGLDATTAAADGEVEDYAVKVQVAAEVDYSDAPNSFSEASHTIVSGIQLGALNDPDSGSLASADADGDGGEDDGITFPTFHSGNIFYDIPAENISATGTAKLHAWIDFDDNGSFDADEYDVVDVVDGTAQDDLSWSKQAEAAATGPVFARFRLTTDPLTSSDAATAASDGEVEDYKITTTPLTYAAVCTVVGGSGDPYLDQTLFYRPVNVVDSRMNHLAVLGAPDSTSSSASRWTTLGRTGGTIMATFTDNILSNTGDSSADISIVEIGAPESTSVHLFPYAETAVILEEAGIQPAADGSYLVGTATAAASLDIDAVFGNQFAAGRLQFGAVKLISTTGSGDGPDMDAITAENSLACSAIRLPSDYSDAPILTYGEASHVVGSSALYLGSVAPDAEASARMGTDNGANADGDNSVGSDDEDGIVVPSTLFSNHTDDITIPASDISGTGTGTLHAWIDFDRDGAFEAAEYASVSFSNGATAPLVFTSYGTVGSAGTTYARFRLTSDSSVTASSPIGAASDGEVEDYAVTITASDVDLVTIKTLSSGDDTPNEGDTVAYSIAVRNDGPGNATNVSLTDLLPDGLTATTNNGTTDDGAGNTVGTYNATSGLWTIGNLANGATATLTLEGTIDTGESGNTITNTTTAAAGNESDPNDSTNDLTESVTVLLRADVSISKTNTVGVNGEVDQASDTVTSGATTTYTLVVTNNGPDTFSGAVVKDVIVSGLSCTSTDAVTITGDGVPSGSFTISDLTGAGITLGTLADGEKTTISYSCDVN